jgi:hypothetical protein
MSSCPNRRQECSNSLNKASSAGHGHGELNKAPVKKL